MSASSPTRRLAVVLTALALSGCASDAPTAADPAAVHDHPVAADVVAADVARILDTLRRETAPWHNPRNAEAAGYTVMIGCIDERVVEGVTPATARGMGYHPANLALFDDNVELHRPETLVYGLQADGRLRLAAFDYFVPASLTYPSPSDGGVPPVMPGLDLPFTWSAVHGGWMFHIWLWWHNPDGMFANWNPTVPLCGCELDPQTGACLPD